MALDLPEGLMTVVEFQHVKPGKGGAFVRTKLKNFRTGAVLDRTFRADEKVPLAMIDKREMQYLYREGNAYVFMDSETYDQLHVEASDLGDAVRYLKEGAAAVVPVYEGQVVGIELPAAVELDVTETEPGLQGDRVSGARKAATLETGVDSHREEIDALLRKLSEHWALERMPAIDRALLRLGGYELGWQPELPTAVVIDEAVDLARQYSTKDSGRFVNALLSRMAGELRSDGSAS